MDERLRFVARLLEGEKLAPLCAEFGISRKTGYTIFEPLQGLWGSGILGSEPTFASPGQSIAGTHRGDDRAPEARVSELGRAEDPRKAAAAIDRAAAPRDQHRGRGAGPSRAGPPAPTATPCRHRDLSYRGRPRRTVSGARLQGRNHARQSALLLSA